MNQKCQQKKKEEEAKKQQETSSEPAVATTEEGTVTVPLVEPEPEKALSMKSFVILGITAAMFDIFYAPCTQMGDAGEIPLSPYVGSNCDFL